MLKLPHSDRTPLLRCDYSDDSAWTELCRLVETPDEEGFTTYISFVDDPTLAGKTIDELMALVEGGDYHSFFYVADHEALTNPECPILVIDLHEERGSTFRVIPAHIPVVDNNLFTANMDFSSFARDADPDGVLRAFKD